MDEQVEQRAVQAIEQRLKDGPAEHRIVVRDIETSWLTEELRNITQADLHILGRSTDIAVFFDQAGKLKGWRDHGRSGADTPGRIDRDDFLRTVIAELDLPKETRLGRLQPRQLPGIGWTSEAVLFLAEVPSDDQILRIWTEPHSLRIIQLLIGAK